LMKKAAAVAVVEAIDQERAGVNDAARLAARAEERARRLSVLNAELPPLDVRAARLAALAQSAQLAERAAREALLLREALRETTPTTAERSCLEAELRMVQTAQNEASERLHRLERGIAAHTAALERDAADGIGERLADLSARLATATARRDALEREAAAFALLDRLLNDNQRETHDRYVAPVTAALSPFLTTVFPAAELVMGQGLVPEQLVRGGALEVVTALSGGTREQIAILARLGFASIEAAAGRPVPVILDDAMVYADDARIARMFESLSTAACQHQVIILTCRERAFSAIGGNRLRLASWNTTRS
jgi:hypothetical protein